MAESILRAAAVGRHFQCLGSDLLQFVSSKNICGHGKRKFSALPGSCKLHQTSCSGASKCCASLNTRHMASFLRPCLSTQVFTSCSVDYELQRRNNCASLGVIHLGSSHYVQVRQKSKNRQRDDNDDDESDDSDEDDALADDDFEAPPNYKIVKMIAASTRADTIVSHALDVGRSNLEEIFLGSGLYLNGDKLLKKSTKMEIGDYADLVVEKAEDQLKVKRVKLLKIYSEKTSKDKFRMKVRVWKAPFLIAKPAFEPKDS